MGAQRATAAVTWLVQHYPLWGVVNIGFTGALHRQMATGDAVLVSQIQCLHYDRAGVPGVTAEAITPDDGFARTAKLAATAAALGRHEGVLLSAPAVVATAADKQRLGQRSGALAVDMESYNIACVAQAYHLPFFPLRTIFDTLADELPMPAAMLTTADGVLKPGYFAWYALQHPRLLASLPRLWSKARVASRNLESWLCHFLSLLGQQSVADASGRR
jgi:nucleoside phosphorylase